MLEARGWLILALSVVVALIVVEVLRRLLAGPVGRRWPIAGAVGRRCARPAFAAAILLGARLASPSFELSESVEGPVERVLDLGLTVAATWLAVQAAYAATDVVLLQLEDSVDDGTDDRETRRVRTQLLLMRRIAAAVAVVVAAGVMLLSFPSVRAVGAGLLASAGVAGIIAGIAARSTLGNVLAGLQIAFGNALRIGDVVVVEGEWGRIEEMTLTYVVVRIWDERRLILPVSHLTENPFENWSRHDTSLLGTVYLTVDWTVPVDEVRAEVHRVVEASPLWDRRACSLLVTDVLPEGTVQIRALVSAADADSWWDLRCQVREHLVKFLREQHPYALPRTRAELTGPVQLAGDGSSRRERQPRGTGSKSSGSRPSS